MQNLYPAWLTSLRHYLAMSLLLSSPANLPHDPRCILLTIASYFALGLLIVDEQNSYAAICAKIALELGMLGAIAHAGLSWRNRLARLTQTFSALSGVNLVMTAATIPLFYLLSDRRDEPDGLMLTIWILTLTWNLAVISLIFKRAFEISTQLSAMISFHYIVVYLFFVFLIFR